MFTHTLTDLSLQTYHQLHTEELVTPERRSSSEEKSISIDTTPVFPTHVSTRYLHPNEAKEPPKTNDSLRVHVKSWHFYDQGFGINSTNPSQSSSSSSSHSKNAANYRKVLSKFKSR